MTHINTQMSFNIVEAKQEIECDSSKWCNEDSSEDRHGFFFSPQSL